MKRYSNNKDINDEVTMLIRDGWKYIGRKKHSVIVSPKGAKLSVPGTPSDIRSLYNFRRDVKHLIDRGKLYAA